MVLVGTVFEELEAFALNYGTDGLLVAVKNESVDTHPVETAEPPGLGAPVYQFT